MSSLSDVILGNEGPLLRIKPPGPSSRRWYERSIVTSAPMGMPRSTDVGLVYEAASGVNVLDADGNRYVDLAAGFGAMLLGHGHPRIVQALREQSERLFMAVGDLYPSTTRLELEECLITETGLRGYQVMWGQSGSDAITAALKTAMLATNKPSVIAFSGAYHGLGNAPLSLCGLREGYRLPFASQLNPHVEFLPYPADPTQAAVTLQLLRDALQPGCVGAVVIESILGRGGCIVPPSGFLRDVFELSRSHAALFIADEIWTGLGRAGSMIFCESEGVSPDLVCFGKGLGGGVPISACLGRSEVMKYWRRTPEVVHTSTFAGASLAARTAIETLHVLSDDRLPERSMTEGKAWADAIREACLGLPVVADVRGRGFMIGIDFGGRAGLASVVMFKLLERGYIVSTGGGVRDVVVLTPPLNIDAAHRGPFIQALVSVLSELA